ncbi:FxLYD domain-containing protein [Streptomyces sp. NPDC059696]|uniref:FxLYD domain-containing protein n=1 Tax=Streptomyces sp. NPDC059696 TaxID=3346911 RepID=UPI0036CE9F41
MTARGPGAGGPRAGGTTARRRGRRAAGGAALALGLSAVLAGCSDYDSPSDTARKAESAVGSIASQASEAVESATAEAGRRLDDIQGGVDVKNDVTTGPPVTESDGRVRTEVTARNTDDSTRSFAVQVDFRDADGQLVDTVIVTVDHVQPGHSATATARSTHDLSGTPRPEVTRAVRY